MISRVILYGFKKKIYKIYFNFYIFYYKRFINQKINRILQYDETFLIKQTKLSQERALPGFKRFKKSGYYKYMLFRYLYCIKKIKNKILLDAGCGLGWGSFLISNYAKKVIAIDIDSESIQFAKKVWNDKKIIFKECSIFDIESLKTKFDVIIGMEIIEHLRLNEGIEFVSQCYHNLKQKGILILSSKFPKKKNIKKEVLKDNTYHLKLYSKEDIRKINKSLRFSKIKFLGDFIVIMKK